MESPNDERQRILAMLEAGKISALECSDLLRALNHSSKTSSDRFPTQPQYLAIVGASLVLIGFFLPWFRMDMFQELHRMMGQMIPSVGVPQAMQGVSSVMVITGGGVGRGMGWIILLLGAVSGVLPLVAGELNFIRQWLISAVSTGIGAVILLYLLIGNIQHASLGIWIVLGGYFFLGASLWRQYIDQDSDHGVDWDQIG